MNLHGLDIILNLAFILCAGVVVIGVPHYFNSVKYVKLNAAEHTAFCLCAIGCVLVLVAHNFIFGSLL
jgi:hypothetical protein